MAIVTSHLNFNSKYHDKCKFSLKLIPLATTFTVFSFEVLQSYQLCALRENSIKKDDNVVKHPNLPVIHPVGNFGIFVQFLMNINWKQLRTKSASTQIYLLLEFELKLK